MIFILWILQTQAQAAKEGKSNCYFLSCYYGYTILEIVNKSRMFNLTVTLQISVKHTERSSDGDAVRHSFGMQVKVAVLFFKGRVAFFNLIGDSLKLHLKFKNGILGRIVSKQPLRIFTN